MKFINAIYLFLLMLTAVSVASCTSDLAENEDAGGGKAVNVRLSLRSRAVSGTGVPQDPDMALDVERFNRYWVVFTDGSADNTIVAIVKNTCDLTERDEFMVSLSPGTYKVYGFANMSDSYLESLGIAEGSAMPDLSSIGYIPDNRFFGNGVTTLLPVETFYQDYKDGGNYGIPMTSVNGQTVHITNAVTVDTSIEVVRMFAKLEFVYSNDTGTDILLRSQSVSNLSVNRTTGGYIPLCNDDSRSLEYLQDKPFTTLSHSYGEGLKLTTGATGVKRSFYVLESLADAVTNSFLLDFDVVRFGLAPGTEPTEAADYMRYALTDPNTLTAIRRNDWIRIPVVFSDWQMRLEGRSYPPIGGYATADIKQTPDNEFVATFQMAGEFVLRPFIRKFGDGSSWFGIDNKTRVIGTPTITVVSDPMGILEKVPELNGTGEIMGSLKFVAGATACLSLSVKVVNDKTPSVPKVLTRKIFITQK